MGSTQVADATRAMLNDVYLPWDGAIRLAVNGAERQCSDVSQLIWSTAETIAHLSQLFELRPGDLIFTGTPEGVGAIERGDLMTGSIDGLGELNVRVV